MGQQTLKKLAAAGRSEKQKASSQETELFIDSVMKHYYLPWATDFMKSPFQRDSWAKAFAAFLFHVGTGICKDMALSHEVKQKMETRLRATLDKGRLGEMPERVVPDGVPPRDLRSKARL